MWNFILKSITGKILTYLSHSQAGDFSVSYASIYFTLPHYHWIIVQSPITGGKIVIPPFRIWNICMTHRLKGRKTHCPQLSLLTPKKPCSMLHNKALCHRAKSSGQFTFYRQLELFAGRISLVIRLEYSQHVVSCLLRILNWISKDIFNISRSFSPPPCQPTC